MLGTYVNTTCHGTNARGATTRTLHIQALWSSFYATGDTKYLERVVELALPWLEYELEVGFQRLVEPNMDMPDSLSGTSCLIRRKEHGAAPRF